MKTLIQQLGVKVKRPCAADSSYHFYTTAKDTFLLVDACIEGKGEWNLDKNGSQQKQFVNNSNTSFSGSTVEAFTDSGKGIEVNMQPFNEAKENLKGFSAALSTGFAPISNQRKRKLSEHDGEYSIDRQWEVCPFNSTHKVKSGISPVLKINVDFCFRARYTAKELTNFGAWVWAIFSKLEESGISCEVNLRQKVTHLATSGKMKGSTVNFTTNVKQAGEYIDENAVARCFTAAFYRIGNFTMQVACLDSENSRACSSLGSVVSIPFSIAPGEINLSIRNQPDNPEKICADILKALKGSV